MTKVTFNRAIIVKYMHIIKIITLLPHFPLLLPLSVTFHVYTLHLKQMWWYNIYMKKILMKKEIYSSPKAKAKHEKKETPAKKKLEAKKGMKS